MQNLMMVLMILALLAACLTLAVLFGVPRATLVLIGLRPACDRSFDWIKLATGQSSGPGAALNLLVIALAAIALIKRPAALLAAPVMAWIGVLIAALASMAHSTDPAGGLRLFMTFVTYTAIVILPFAMIESIEDATLCLKAALLSSVIPVIWGLIEVVMTPSIMLGDERLESTFTHSNILAFYFMGVLTLILFMMTSRMVSLTPGQRQLLTIYCLPLIILLLATKTRSAWIAMALIFLGHALISDRRLLLGILALPLVLLIPGIGERIMDLGGGNTNDAYANLNSYAWRKLLWQETWDWLQDNPQILFGHGLDLFVPHVPLFFSRGAKPDGIGAHNAILQVYFEMGLAGIMAFAALFTTVFASLLKHMARDFAGAWLFTLLAISHLLIAYSDNLLDYLQFQWFFWFCTATICASTPYLQPAPNRPGNSSMPSRGKPFLSPAPEVPS